MTIAKKLAEAIKRTGIIQEKNDLDKKQTEAVNTNDSEKQDKLNDDLMISIPAIKNSKYLRETNYKYFTQGLIEKIQKTPYWSEYSVESKEKMISKYIDRKVKEQKHSGISFNYMDKFRYIQELLESVV